MGGFGFNSSKSSSKPVFAPGQMDLIENFFTNILPGFTAGKPVASSEVAGQRMFQDLTRQYAQRGLTGSGLEARALRDAAATQATNREQNVMDILFNASAPLGQRSSSSGFGVSVGAGSGGAPGIG